MSSTYWQAALTFDEEGYNPTRAGRFGVWRVLRCVEVMAPIKITVEPTISDTRGRVDVLWLMVARRYSPGCIVNPVKLALEYQRRIEESETLLFGRTAWQK